MKRRGRFTCDWPFIMLVILCDGRVVCGCAQASIDKNEERTFGNIYDNSLHDLWNSPKIVNLRRGLNAGFSDFCRDCTIKRIVCPNDPIPVRDVYQENEMLRRIFIEPTILCNLRCYKSDCHLMIENRKKKTLSLEIIIKTIDEVGHHLTQIYLFNYGESFLHPQCVDIIEYIKEYQAHIYLSMSTNGIPLNEEKIRRIVSAGMDVITFSVDGIDQHSYGKYRTNGKFNVIIQRVSCFYFSLYDKIGQFAVKQQIQCVA